MIELIIQMLQLNEFEGQSELIEIAKGKYKIQDNVKGIRRQIKREKAWQQRKR